MKRLFILFAALMSLPFLSAQISFNTGSDELDADLNTINTNANLDLSAFKTDLSVSFGVSMPVIDNLFSQNMSAGEVYLALEISTVAGKPIDDVILVYQRNKGKGWGVIAQEMGIKPGSDEFHALKGKCKDKKDHGNGNGKGKGKNKQ